MSRAEATTQFRDFSALVGGVAKWLARKDLNDMIPAFIWLAECDIQHEVEFRLRDAIATGTTVQDQDFVQLPLDFVSGRYFQWDNTALGPIEMTSWDWTDYRQKIADPPTRVGTIHGTRFYVGPALGVETFTLYYQAGVTHLGTVDAVEGSGGPVESNILLEEYPGALLYGALSHSAPYVGADQRLPMWKETYLAMIVAAQRQEWNARMGAGPLRQRYDGVIA